jgi:hypothetical protein
MLMKTDPSRLSRRRFLEVAALGATGAASSPAAPADAGAAAADGKTLLEPATAIPFAGGADVIVCGAGPAGVAAAIAAARAGARVRLFEWRGCLGGVWTAGLVGYFLDFAKPGIAREIRERLDERGGRTGASDSRFSYHPEILKLLLEEMCTEAGVAFQYHTRVAAAHREGRRLAAIVTDSKSGRQAWRAPVFIDATGDGDLGAQAGCAFEFGDEAAGRWQPMSLNALLAVKNAEALRGFVRFADPRPGENSDSAKKTAIREAIRSTGHESSYGGPTLWHVKDNLLIAMLNHEYSVKPFDAAGVTAATVRARAEMHRMVDGLRGLGGPWEGLQIVATAEQIGVRDGRRIAGRTTVKKEDLVGGARHEDAVVRATFGVDVHQTAADRPHNDPAGGAGIKVKPYDIPLRALIARDVDGLMMAGRCISGDFIAHSSYRVTGNAVAMGEAAGTVAALAARSSRLPHEVPWPEAAAALRPKAAS